MRDEDVNSWSESQISYQNKFVAVILIAHFKNKFNKQMLRSKTASFNND